LTFAFGCTTLLSGKEVVAVVDKGLPAVEAWASDEIDGFVYVVEYSADGNGFGAYRRDGTWFRNGLTSGRLSEDFTALSSAEAKTLLKEAKTSLSDSPERAK
jgi:hypothetical protein